MSSRIQVTLSNKKLIAHGTTEVSFTITGKSFLFQAGQYIVLKLPYLLYDDPKGNFRLFSITSSPNNKTVFSIAFRNSASGFKKSLLELPYGSTIEIEGPFGYLTLPRNTHIPLAFAAGGIGITPFLSMIRYANEEKTNNRIHLLYFNKNKKNAAYLPELEQLSRKSHKFTMRLFTGSINLVSKVYEMKDPTYYLWYIAGPTFFVTEFTHILYGLGVENNHIFSENYVGYE